MSPKQSIGLSGPCLPLVSDLPAGAGLQPEETDLAFRNKPATVPIQLTREQGDRSKCTSARPSQNHFLAAGSPRRSKPLQSLRFFLPPLPRFWLRNPPPVCPVINRFRSSRRQARRHGRTPGDSRLEPD